MRPRYFTNDVRLSKLRTRRAGHRQWAHVAKETTGRSPCAGLCVGHRHSRRRRSRDSSTLYAHCTVHVRVLLVRDELVVHLPRSDTTRTKPAGGDGAAWWRLNNIANGAHTPHLRDSSSKKSFSNLSVNWSINLCGFSANSCICRRWESEVPAAHDSARCHHTTANRLASRGRPERGDHGQWHLNPFSSLHKHMRMQRRRTANATATADGSRSAKTLTGTASDTSRSTSAASAGPSPADASHTSTRQRPRRTTAERRRRTFILLAIAFGPNASLPCTTRHASRCEATCRRRQNHTHTPWARVLACRNGCALPSLAE